MCICNNLQSHSQGSSTHVRNNKAWICRVPSANLHVVPTSIQEKQSNLTMAILTRVIHKPKTRNQKGVRLSLYLYIRILLWKGSYVYIPSTIEYQNTCLKLGSFLVWFGSLVEEMYSNKLIFSVLSLSLARKNNDIYIYIYIYIFPTSLPHSHCIVFLVESCDVIYKLIRS